MNLKPKTFGVVIGRFQVAQLHVGHHLVLETAQREQENLLVVLGATGGQPTATDPLDVEARMQLIRQQYPDAIVHALHDQPSNEGWSRSLDALIARVTQNANAVLYGSRDCFESCYTGTLPIRILPPIPEVSGSRLRTEQVVAPHDSSVFRQGMVYAASKRFPTSYQAVDIVILRRETDEVLLGWKAEDNGLRFPGGFVDPTDESLERAVKREAYEETGGMEIGTPVYIGSTRINDHRYRKGPDAVMSAIFLAPYIFGALHPGDDLEGLVWIRIQDVEKRLMPSHLPIWKYVTPHLKHTENAS